jgi:hypothetical protein
MAYVRVRVRAGIRIQFLNRREVIEMNYAQHTPATFKQAAMQQIANIFRTYAACPSRIPDEHSSHLRRDLARICAGTGLRRDWLGSVAPSRR